MLCTFRGMFQYEALQKNLPLICKTQNEVQSGSKNRSSFYKFNERRNDCPMLDSSEALYKDSIIVFFMSFDLRDELEYMEYLSLLLFSCFAFYA